MNRSQLRPCMTLAMSCGIPPTLLRFKVSRNCKYLNCQNKGWMPKRTKVTKALLEQMEKELT